ncbi:hypothetical protein [Octadecabacter ascidiaceicola]|uniref:hypothetical protein n=1 Tax=Octadecabacter ascidiaceicola TaxID=1655543 RepID=UPI001FEB7CE2|nr:hypothetical protein [Octadecabacter ascidiaceicola]
MTRGSGVAGAVITRGDGDAGRAATVGAFCGAIAPIDVAGRVVRGAGAAAMTGGCTAGVGAGARTAGAGSGAAATTGAGAGAGVGSGVGVSTGACATVAGLDELLGWKPHNCSLLRDTRGTQFVVPPIPART